MTDEIKLISYLEILLWNSVHAFLILVLSFPIQLYDSFTIVI